MRRRKMNNFEIRCRGVANISASLHGDMNVDLEQVDLSFLENIPVEDIAKYIDIKEVLGEIDYDTIVDYLEERYYIEPIRVRE